MRNLIAMGLLMAAAPALAQSAANSSGEIVPERPANLRPADAQNTDGRARASAEVIAVIAAAKQRPSRVIQMMDAASIRDLVLMDGKLDDADIDLLDELTANTIRAVTISPLSGGGAPVVIGTVSGDAKRTLEAPFTQRYDALWDAKDPVAGWTGLLREARRSDSSHSRVRKFLGKKALEAAQSGTAPNAYGPAVKLVGAFSSRNEKLPLPDRALGRRLQYEAFVDADIAVDGRLPDFIYSWLKQPPKP